MAPLDSKYAFFTGIILLVLLEYVLLMVAFGLFRYYSNCCRTCGKDRSILKDERKMRFEDTYESFSPCLQYLLLITRILSLGWIFGVGVIGGYVRHGHIWFYFTFWNLELISIYFILAMLCSILGLRKNSIATTRRTDERDLESLRGGNEEVLWPSCVNGLGYATQVFLEVCGGTALLITVVNFVLLNPNFELWNVTQHFVTSLTLVVDLLLSNIEVRADHFTYNISWILLYLFFIWPLVILGNINDWPYYFLRLDTNASYFWYTIFVAIDVGFYFAFYGISKLKVYMRKCLCRRSKGSKDPDAELHKNALTGVAKKDVSDRKNIF